MSSHRVSQTDTTRPKRRQGLCLSESPVLAANGDKAHFSQVLIESSLLNEVPSHQATFPEVVTNTATRACELRTFTGAKSNGRLRGLHSESRGSSFRSSQVVDHRSTVRNSLVVEVQQVNPPRLDETKCQKSLEFLKQAMPAATATNEGCRNGGLDFHTISLATSCADANGQMNKAGSQSGPMGLSCADGNGIEKNSLPVVFDSNKLSPFDSNADTISIQSARSQRSQRCPNKVPPFPKAGMIAAMVASISFSTSMLFIKLIPDGDSLQERAKQVFSRGCFLMLFTAIAIIYEKSTFLVKRDEIFITVLRSSFGFVALFGAYTALQYISIGESQAIIFSAPIWTSILGYFILGEKFSLSILLGLPVSIFGLILIAHPDLIVDVRSEFADEVQQIHLAKHLNQTSALYMNATMLNLTSYTIEPQSMSGLDLATSGNQTMDDYEDEDPEVFAESYFDNRLPGILLSVGTSFVVSIVYIVLKFRKSTPVQTTTFHLGLSTVILCTIIIPFIGYGRWPNTVYEWLLLLGSGFFSWIGQSLFQWSTQYENASVLSVIRSLDVVMSFIYSALILHDDIHWTSVLGAALILAVVGTMMLQSYIVGLCKKRSK